MITKLDHAISRRRFLTSTSVATTVALLAPRHLFAQDDGLVQTARKTAAVGTINLQKLRGNVSVLMGAGGNIAVLPGRDGKLLIDAGFAGARPKISDALASISSDPIKHLVNTHWHFDHTDGNEWLHSAGAAILAHENTRKHLSTATRVEGWNFTFPPSPAGAIPAEVFEDERTVKLNGATIALKHYAPAHTDSDISIDFTNADILHVADTFWNGYYPFIDYSTGGSIDGMIRATEGNLAKVTDKMIVIPGHGPVGDRSQLTFYHDLLVTVRDKVATLIDRRSRWPDGACRVRGSEVRCRGLFRVTVQRGWTARHKGHDRRTGRLSNRLCGLLHGASRRPAGVRCYRRRDRPLSAHLRRQATRGPGKSGCGASAYRIATRTAAAALAWK